MSPSEQEPGALERLLPTDPSTVAGYRLLGRLGAGGMGVVYLGRTEAGELAAVKVTHSDQAGDPGFRARFRREVDAARRVVSPWAVPVTGADPDAPEPWLATAFVPGPSLAEAIVAHGPLPTRSARILGVAIARALAAVHAAGLVHRDVKPGNVLLAVDGPRLIDFGIARTVEETVLTAPDMVVGTPGFLAPEQAEARGDEIGPPSDVFALGCLLAYAVTARLPFGSGAVDALLYRTVHDDPDLSGIETELAQLIGECLAKEPRARPTADQVAERLAEDGPLGGADWLPAHVVRTIAHRSARMLALPDIEPTQGPEPERTPAPDPPQALSSRRKFLLGAGGAVLLAGGGGGLWAALRGGEGATKGGPPPKKRRYVIGVQADLSGPQKALGMEQERGARLAVEAHNARGGRPFPIELATADDAGDTAKVSAATDRMTGDRDVLAVLGSTGDYTTQAALPAYNEALLPLMTVSAGLNLLTAAKPLSPSIIRVCPAHPVAGSHLAYFLQLYYRQVKTKTARPGLLQERTDDTYAWQYVTIMNIMMRAYGHRPYPRVVPAGTDAYGPIIKDMLDAGIDSYVHGGTIPSAVKAARALADAGFEGPRIGGPHLLSAEFLRQAGPAAEGWAIAAPVLDPLVHQSAKGFAAAYRKRFGAAPGFYAGESFDAVSMMIEEIVKAARSGGRPAPADLAAALRRKSFAGVMGKYQFDAENGERKSPRAQLYAVDNGRFRHLMAAPAQDPGKG
ncbi:bifunctional serine/threonine-protein kinase/ABC transporter substrate-binding protein [Streptomyces albipurpureus]|uniref:Bifunctional serine/threonine-protein kinase/ABC transporter substrate-binding protein n=1 Tax=Streptomyces albipurpureus TaxID=2897419 RepID=A0ABT0V116_9ACTN|nr:bifunctional serine/threonine-protein kinase/ABC transporter substrate-binding protein [Streptomyces sp. CWNU-1]MCM2393879.1 bifunctional serine/threonine-protein kinase/ABC transporter substrate-binding protein [Streptomyces sp. CWNU-1]